MKILQVIPYFIPAYSYGGPIKVCFDLSKELVKIGHEVTVATTDTLDGKNRIESLEEEIEKIRIIRFKNISNRLAKDYNGYLPIGFYTWVKNNLRDYEVVHCHDFFTYQNIVISYFCRKYNIPFIIQPHGTLSPFRQNAKFLGVKKIFLLLFKKILLNSKTIIALTENEKKEISSLDSSLPKKIEIIPNGLKITEFEDIHGIDLFKIYSIPRENKIIGYIGRVQFIKGIDVSLEILASIKNKVNFTYLIIGPDEGEKAKLEKIIANLKLESRVIFTGILSGKEKLETMKSCDLFLFTSRSEGLPMTVLEIAALGVPQIISKNCNVPEIEKYGGGFEFDLDEGEEITNKILEILSNKDLRANLSVYASKLAEEHFNLSSVVERINKLYLS